MKIVLNRFEKILLYFGFCLLVINIIGLFISLRNESIHQETAVNFADDFILTENELYNRINKPVIDKKEYIINLNKAVYQGIAWYWSDAGINKYNLRIPFYENYLLFIASYLYPQEYLKYEFVDYRRAIERGIGLCSQHAIIVSEILKEKRIPSFIIGLSNHVVLRVQVNDNPEEWWVLDPTYGVVIPYDIDYIENIPGSIGPFYAQMGINLKRIAGLEKLYEKKGNVVSREQGARGYQLVRYFFEPAFYLLKWIIPCILITLSTFLFYNRKKTNNQTIPASL